MKEKMGNMDEHEGTKVPLPLHESHAIMYEVCPKTMKHLADRFAGVSEQNVKELTAMHDIQFRLTYASHNNPAKLQELIRRMEGGGIAFTISSRNIKIKFSFVLKRVCGSLEDIKKLHRTTMNIWLQKNDSFIF